MTRAQKAAAAHEQSSVETNPGSAPPEGEHVVRLEQLRRAFLALPSDQREALQLMAIEGLRVAEVSAILDIPAGAVMSRVGRARANQMRLAAVRLSSAMSRQSNWRRWVPFAAAVAMFAFGWSAQHLMTTTSQKGSLSALLDTAIDAQDAALLRASLIRDLGPMPKDPERIAARLGIDLPEMPPRWTVRATQVVATPDRPGLAVVIDSPELGDVLLFDLLRSEDGPDGPAACPMSAAPRPARRFGWAFRPSASSAPDFPNV